MKHENHIAWYQYPEPDGTTYTEQDLENKSIVEELFNYSQILLATISKYGWKKLIEFHGIDILLEINRKSGWFNDENTQESIDDLKYHCLISGYNPESNIFGKYDENSGIFTDVNGKSSIIKWSTS